MEEIVTAPHSNMMEAEDGDTLAMPQRCPGTSKLLNKFAITYIFSRGKLSLQDYQDVDPEEEQQANRAGITAG